MVDDKATNFRQVLNPTMKVVVEIALREFNAFLPGNLVNTHRQLLPKSSENFIGQLLYLKIRQLPPFFLRSF